MQPVELWGQIGSYLNLDPPAKTEDILSLVDTPGTSGRELRSTARLLTDGSRIRAVVDGVTLGWLPADVVADYRPVLSAFSARGLYATVGAGIRVYDPSAAIKPDPDFPATTDVYVSSYVRLGQPHLLEPLNTPPASPYVLVPEGRKQRVSMDAAAADGSLQQWIRPEGAAWVFCTLHAKTQELTRTTREVVEVRINSVVAGTLTPGMSKSYLPLIALASGSARAVAARGLVKGNHVQVEMSVAALKASEVPQAWLRQHSLDSTQGSTTLSPPATHEDPITDVEEGDRGPGFYADPRGMADERFWDGVGWTSRIRMRPPST